MGSQGRKQYTADFKREGVGLITHQGYSVAEAVQNLGVNAGLLRRWKTEIERTGSVAFPGKGHQTPDQAELHRLREENRRLRMERDILKKATLSSMDACNTMPQLFAREGVAYGTIRASRLVCRSESRGVGTMENWPVAE